MVLHLLCDAWRRRGWCGKRQTRDGGCMCGGENEHVKSFEKQNYKSKRKITNV
jgi:hypothetical protein